MRKISSCGFGGLDDRRVHAVGELVGGGDGDVGEPGGGQVVAVFGEGEGSGDAGDMVAAGRTVGEGQVVFGDDVGDPEPPAGRQDPKGFGERRGFVGAQVDHAVGDDHVDVVVWVRDLLHVSLEELYVGGAGLAGVAPGEVEHLLGHVQAVDLAARPDPAG